MKFQWVVSSPLNHMEMCGSDPFPGSSSVLSKRVRGLPELSPVFEAETRQKRCSFVSFFGCYQGSLGDLEPLGTAAQAPSSGAKFEELVFGDGITHGALRLDRGSLTAFDVPGW